MKRDANTFIIGRFPTSWWYISYLRTLHYFSLWKSTLLSFQTKLLHRVNGFEKRYIWNIDLYLHAFYQMVRSQIKLSRKPMQRSNTQTTKLGIYSCSQNKSCITVRRTRQRRNYFSMIHKTMNGLGEVFLAFSSTPMSFMFSQWPGRGFCRL